MLPFTILLVVISRRASTWVRELLRLFWVVGLVAGGLFAIFRARVMIATQPELNPLVPGAIKLFAIELFCEAFFLSSVLWLPRLFDRLERTSAAMMIAVRQLRSRKSGFLTAISFLAFLGVGLACFGLCFTISIMGGFGNDLKRKILGNNAHVVIDRDREGFTEWRPLLARVRSLPSVQSATPLVQGEVMLTSQTNLSGVILRGIEPNGGGPTQTLSRELIRGRLEYLQQPERLLNVGADERRPVTARESEPGARMLGGEARNPRTTQPPGLAATPVEGPTEDVLPGVVIGRELATNLHLAVGDEVRVVSPFGGMVTPLGTAPKTRLFRVAGIFYSGMYEYDTKYAYITLREAQSFFNYVGDRITSIELRVAEVDNAPALAEQVRPLVSGDRWRVRDWTQLNANLFRALKLEKLMMFVLLGVAILVASFAIVATLLLFVMEKGREIAVLKAMGASDPFVARVFVLVGLLIGLVGSTLGVGTALLVCSLIQQLGIPLDPEVYYIDRLPVFISLPDYLTVMVIALLICLLATVYPARVASRLRPVEGMRFG